jgi:hypothetical protein
MHILAHRWLRLVVTTSAALALWAFAAAHGYEWEMVWLPAVVVGAGWPHRKHTLDRCLRQLRRRQDRGA